MYVEGRLQTNSWEKDGVKQYRTEIVVDKFEFGPKGGGAGGSSTSNAGNAGSNATSTGGNNNSAPVLPEYPTEDINPEDIPF